ncbi:MAG: hypothetical protein K2J24_03310, partial [Muribaculaceae bacterium]|nr:hypothetical protein [Muribaculaceae bacterium]
MSSDGEVKIYPFDRNVYKEVLRSVVPDGIIWETFCCLEKVGAMPKQGVTSMFHFGENYGFIQGVLEANCI